MQQNQAEKRTLSRSQGMVITGAALVIVYLIWNISFLSFLAYPLRLFVTYVHEAGHSTMALLTGGEVINFRVFSNGSGVATTAGGTQALILPAGYIGAALFGAVLFYVANVTRAARTLSILVGSGLIVFSLLYAAPANNIPVALLIGAGGGALLIALGWKATPTINLLVLNVLAIMTALNAVLDVFLLTRYADIVMRSDNGGEIRNDALAFHEEVASFLPASVWAFIWAGIAAALLAAAIYYSILRPLLRDASGPVGTTLNRTTEGLNSLRPRLNRNKKKEDDYSDLF